MKINPTTHVTTITNQSKLKVTLKHKLTKKHHLQN